MLALINDSLPPRAPFTEAEYRRPGTGERRRRPAPKEAYFVAYRLLTDAEAQAEFIVAAYQRYPPYAMLGEAGAPIAEIQARARPSDAPRIALRKRDGRQEEAPA